MTCYGGIYRKKQQTVPAWDQQRRGKGALRVSLLHRAGKFNFNKKHIAFRTTLMWPLIMQVKGNLLHKLIQLLHISKPQPEGRNWLCAMILHRAVPYLLFGSPPSASSTSPPSKCPLSKLGAKGAPFRKCFRVWLCASIDTPTPS